MSRQDDPAVQAAQRYRDRGYPETDGLVGVAREALAPLRAKHQKVQRPDGSWRCTSCRDAYGAHADFPTGTDRLICPEAEL